VGRGEREKARRSEEENKTCLVYNIGWRYSALPSTPVHEKERERERDKTEGWTRGCREDIPQGRLENECRQARREAHLNKKEIAGGKWTIMRR
jgi:hypothetical protein